MTAVAAPSPSEQKSGPVPSGAGRAPQAPGWRSLFRSLTAFAWAIAILAAVVHMSPYWRATLSATDEWTFTGNLTVSPDYMQYRVWERQTQREGPIVTNRFTTEPNEKHLPVFYYWGVGQVARLTGARPEAVYAWSGALFAVALVLLLFGVTRHFLPNPIHHNVALVALVFGGGLGGWLKLLQSTPGVQSLPLVERMLTGPLEEYPVFEEYRSHYVLRTLFDSHFLLLWLACVVAVVAYYFAVRRPSASRLSGAAAAFAAVTVLHVYEGITLVAIGALVTVALWRDADVRPGAVRTLVATTLAVVACYAVLGLVYRRSGLPLPEWRAINILFSTLMLAFPLAWAMLAIGGAKWFREGGVEARFLIGWIAGCTIVTLSGPFFPYPDRGTMTMQVPLTIATAAIYFSRWPRLTRAAAVIALLLFGAAPLWQVTRSLYYSRLRTDAPFQHVNSDHRASLQALRASSDTGDVLLAEPRDLLWLAPEFPGRFYVGHFFLTVRYREKNEALTRALANADSMRVLLERSGTTRLFVNRDRDPARFAVIDGLRPVHESDVGTLFAVEPVGRADGGAP